MPTPNDRLRFAAEYLHTEYDKFVRAAVAPSLGTACAATLISAGPPPRFDIDCSGLPLTRSPKWTGSASYEHRFDLANGGEVTVGGDMTFSASRYLTIDYSPVTRDKGYALFNAEIAYHAPEDRWSLAIWGKNLTKEAYLTGGVQLVDYNKTTINQPRTYGVRLRANF